MTQITGRLAVDADDVLWECLPCYLAHYNQAYGTSHRIDDFHTYRWEEVFQCTNEESVERYLTFHASGGGYAMPPIAGAFNALSKIRKLVAQPPVIVTARFDNLAAETQDMVNRHYPGIFEKIYHTNQVNGKRRKKVEVCQELGVSLLIDDHTGHALDCAAEGINVFLFGHGVYPWNKIDGKLPSKVIPVATWDDVLSELGVQ